MDNLLSKQPALITTDSNEQPVVITAPELRAIRDGRHCADDSQVQGMARYIVERMDDNRSL